MSFEDNPADDDPHGECRHEIERLRKALHEVIQTLRAPAAEYIPAMGRAMGIAINALEDQ